MKPAKRDSLRTATPLLLAIPFILFELGLSGCGRPLISNGGWFPNFFANGDRTVSQVLTPNPASVIINDQEFAWNQIVDELDDYFKIQKEERVRVEDGIVMEGLISTYPTPGATLLEPWRNDSTSGFEKWHATFQTIRRWAKVRVIPSGSTFLVEVHVYKEMENLERPENSAVSGIRTNVSAGVDQDGEQIVSARGQKWYSVGRDTSLEQRILSRIQGRLQP